MEKAKSEALKAFSKVDPYKIDAKNPARMLNLGKKQRSIYSRWEVERNQRIQMGN